MSNRQAMNPVPDGFPHSIRGHHDRITIPTIWIAFALSLLLHATALIGGLPRVLGTPFEDPRPGKTSGALSVRLAPLPIPARVKPSVPVPARAPSAPAVAPRIVARKTPARPPVVPPAPASPAVLALERPAAAAVAPSRAPVERPPAEPAPAYADLAAYIAARRGARAPVQTPSAQTPSNANPPQPPAETEQERHNRIVAENLGLNRTPGFGADPQPGGGIFQVQRMNYYDAEFLFFGWNKDIRRNAQQRIEVRRGDNPSMELAVVRRMIEIIRDHAKDDFVWESVRLGREVTLSLRPADRAGLEAFLIREFFPALR